MVSTKKGADLITVDRATKQDRPVIARLIQLMLYDLSPFFGEWISNDGSYAYRYLDAYWTEQGRNPYLFYKSARLVGFALVSAHSPISGRASCWFMSEYFVLKAQRRRGYGLMAVRDIISRHHGNWEIAAIHKNRDAVSFWSKGLPRLQLTDLKKDSQTHDGFEWVVHTFVS